MARNNSNVLKGSYFAAAPWIVGAVAASVGGLWCDRLCKRIGCGRQPSFLRTYR
jgi:hypothetical protein